MTKMEKDVFGGMYSPSEAVYHNNQKKDNESIEAYRNLCDAVIMQAVSDYRSAIERYRMKSNKWIADTISEIESFFQSEWFKDISPTNGTELMIKLQAELQVQTIPA